LLVEQQQRLSSKNLVTSRIANQASFEGTLIRAAQSNDIGELDSFLNRVPLELDIMSIIDSKSYTLLHYTVYNNQISGTVLLVDHQFQKMRKSGLDESQTRKVIRSWINQ